MINNRFIELDGLRGIAVMLVLISHYSWAYNYHFNIDYKIFEFPYGDFGVQIFFIISGFVIFMTLDYSKSLYHFIISRFSRLYPTYWLSIFLTIFIITLFPVPTIEQYSLTQILANLTMLQGFFKEAHIDQVYWSLQIELIFYLIMGIIFYFKQINKIEYYSIIWLLLSLILILFNIPFEKYFKVLLILEWSPLFIAGIMFYKIKYKESTVLNHIIILSSLLIYLIVLHFQIIERNHIEESPIPYILIIITYIVFYILSYKNILFLKNKYLLFLGYISYPLYLLHNVIGYSIIYRLRQIYDNQLFYITITTVIVILLSYLVTKIMEKPTIKIKLKLYEKIGSS